MSTTTVTTPTLLDKVRKSLRVTTTRFDDEITLYINMCLYDLDRLNIDFGYNDNIEDAIKSYDMSSEIENTIVTYVKGNFGNSQGDYKMQMHQSYVQLREILLLDKSHKKASSHYS